MADYKLEIAKFPSREGAGIILDYINHGYDPGDFYRYVLCNDLKSACLSADYQNRYILFDIVGWLWNYAPSMPVPCWGSEEAFMNWVKVGGMNGIIAGNRE